MDSLKAGTASSTFGPATSHPTIMAKCGAPFSKKWNQIAPPQALHAQGEQLVRVFSLHISPAHGLQFARSLNRMVDYSKPSAYIQPHD
jgi:hypothetical protein